MTAKQDEYYGTTETARRRDEVIRRMANTPPQPRIKTPARRLGKGKKAGEDRATGKGRAVHGR
jgi:hypothetical protein